MRPLRTGDSARPKPDPSGGQAPALHSPIPTPLDSGPVSGYGTGSSPEWRMGAGVTSAGAVVCGHSPGWVGRPRMVQLVLPDEPLAAVALTCGPWLQDR